MVPVLIGAPTQLGSADKAIQIRTPSGVAKSICFPHARRDWRY
jgi:hypothetical protein